MAKVKLRFALDKFSDKIAEKLFISKYFIFITALFLADCDTTPSLRFPNGTIVEVKIYELAITDTCNVVTFEDGIFRINSFDDSLLSRIDTIYYREPDVSLYKPVFGRIDQVITNSREPEIKELYRFKNNKAVFLVGYVTGDPIHPYTLFDPPIVILSSYRTSQDSSVSTMLTLDEKGNKTGDGVKVKSVVSLKKRGKMLMNEMKEEGFMYELTIAQDAVVNFGEHGLIVPEAIIISSKLFYVENHGLMAEWGLRTRPKQIENIPSEPERETYLEFNTNSTINRGVR